MANLGPDAERVSVPVLTITGAMGEHITALFAGDRTADGSGREGGSEREARGISGDSMNPDATATLVKIEIRPPNAGLGPLL